MGVRGGLTDAEGGKHWAGAQTSAPEGREQCWLDIQAGANLNEVAVWGPVTGGSSHGSGKAGFAELTNTT